MESGERLTNTYHWHGLRPKPDGIERTAQYSLYITGTKQHANQAPWPSKKVVKEQNF